MTRRSGSIVRITSSDPRSSLSSTPIQFDLDDHLAGGAGAIAGEELGIDSSTANLMQHSASAARRRRESGRLLNGINGNSNASPSRNTSSIGRASSRTASPLSHSVLPVRPARSAQRRQHTKATHENSPLRLATSSPELPDAEDEWRLSPSSSHTFLSAGSDNDETPLSPSAPVGPPSILRREPQNYASLPQMESRATSPMLYSMTQESWEDPAWKGHTSDSSIGSYENDLSLFGMLPPPPLHSRLPPGAGRGLHRAASSPRLGSLTAAEARAIWPDKRIRSIRLREPDWTPYADVHDRARERLEAAAHIASKPRSSSPQLTEKWVPSHEPFGDLLPWDEEEEVKDSIQTLASRLQQPDEQIEEFWFERFTPSTAAAGRDWDWRKRRRARRLAIEAAEGSSAGVAAQEPASPTAIDGSDGNVPEGVAASNSVGMTDVQLQKQRNSRKQPFVISSGAEDLASRQTALTSGSPVLRSARDTQPASPAGASVSSPLSKALRLKRYSTPDGTADRPAPHGTARAANGVDSSVPNHPGRRARHSMPVKKTRRSSQIESKEAEEAEEAVNVPGRLSSLTPKLGPKRRGISAKRERDAALTAQLLADAETVATDDEDGDDGDMARVGMPSDVSADLSIHLSNGHTSANSGPRSSADVWSTVAAAAKPGWSSADAYGTSPPPLQAAASLAPPEKGKPRHPAFDLASGAIELTRQGSKADSQSDSQGSSGSSTAKQGQSDPPVFNVRPRSASRKGILSSATLVSYSEPESPARRGYENGSAIMQDASRAEKELQAGSC